MRTLSLLLVLSAAPLAGVAAAQDALEEAKAHYAAAAYEEALSTLTRVEAAPPINTTPPMNRVELEQYRAFCFIALGKLSDAERAVASLVAADPRYVPSHTVASPRVLQLVSDMRRKELPGVARKLFDDGRAAFKAKEFVRAGQSFDLLLELLNDPVLKGRPENEDLRVLAEGFVALTDASAAPPARAEEPAPMPAQAPRLETVITPPIAVQQPLPEWVPPDAIAGSREYSGAVKVLIGVDGRVKSATIEKATYPTYDARLLQAARLWEYRPATRNGEPVESEKLISIMLRRRD
jgi:tetratricopeptide (TPR) repeat protein